MDVAGTERRSACCNLVGLTLVNTEERVEFGSEQATVRRARAFPAILIFVVAAGGAVEGQTPRLFGTWTLNLLASTLPGPPPKSQTVTFQPSGREDIAGVEETIYPDGTRTTIEYTARVDGRDYPIAGPAEILARTDTISMTKVDDSRIVWTYKKGGAVVLSLRGSISSDGRTLRMTAPGNLVLVYERK